MSKTIIKNIDTLITISSDSKLKKGKEMSNLNHIKNAWVEIKNDKVAPLEAPLLYIDAAIGITPHEHNGIGTPNIDALKEDIKPGVPTLLEIISFEVKIYNTPEMINPRIR